jgi:hypothetical protein
VGSWSPEAPIPQEVSGRRAEAIPGRIVLATAAYIWVLNRAVAEVDAAAAALDGHRLATPDDLTALQRIARTRAQGLREILDEYQAGLYDG